MKAIPEDHWSTTFRSWSVIAGFVVGMLVLAWAGRAVARTDWHKDFTRFHPMLAPDSLYQPTIAEMCAIVRARCRSDQVLVVIAGNSVLLGVGQPATRMWSTRLQELLGPHYAVVNLAFRGATPTDGGAVVAEVLRKEFPKQILIANAGPLQGLAPAGIDTYRFILLDAYYKGLLLPWQHRDEEIQKSFSEMKDRNQVLETKVSMRLDALLYFRTFWNWWSYNKFMTSPTPMMPKLPEAFRPRKSFADAENDYEEIPVSSRFRPESLAAEMRITSNSTSEYYTKSADGKWVAVQTAHDGFLKSLRDGFPDPLKKRTLMLIGRSNPYYTKRLADDIRERDNLAYRDTVAGWNSTGYSALEYGQAFNISDYGDRTHLTSTGGRKLAETVAPAVRELASKLNYLSN